MEITYKVIVVLMKFCSGMLKAKYKCQVELLVLKMRSGTHGHALLDSQCNKYGEELRMGQM